jgi:hypothetical protein
MLNKIPFKDFLQLVDDTYNHYSFELRYGQTIMNVLHGANPFLYNQIVSTDSDCYYDDGIVRLTLQKLEQEWI